MAFSLSSERPAVAALSLNPFARFLNWVRKLHAARAQRVALAHLLEMEEHRLDDLGINRQDVIEAMTRQEAEAGRRLAAIRAASAATARAGATLH